MTRNGRAGVGRARVHHARDVLARDPGGSLRLPREALDDVLGGGGIGEENLHRDALLEPPGVALRTRRPYRLRRRPSRGGILPAMTVADLGIAY